MAAALARGWGEPVLATDSGSGRAAALAAELGGEAPDSTLERGGVRAAFATAMDDVLGPA
jgi:hypothetical protein